MSDWLWFSGILGVNVDVRLTVIRVYSVLMSDWLWFSGILVVDVDIDKADRFNVHV